MAKEITKRKRVFSWILTFVIITAMSAVSITLGRYIVTQIILGQNPSAAKWGNAEIFERGITWIDKGNNKGYYQFDDKIIKITDKENSNYYDFDRLSPDVNIWGEEGETENRNKLPKDTFVRVTGKFEVACELYLKVAEEDWPSLLKYEIDAYDKETGEGTWQLLAPGHRYYESNDSNNDSNGDTHNNINIYKYHGDLHFFDGIGPLDLHIFKDNHMTVNFSSLDDFNKLPTKFSLNFSVWIEQTNFR